MFDPPERGSDRRSSLEEAIRRFVRPQQTLYFAVGHSRPHAAMYEICRQFRSAKFTMAVLGASHAFVLPIHFGMIEKLITTFAGDTYPTPGPSPVIDRAWKSGMEIESWSVLSYVERLRAGARGASWTITQSLRGSAMLEEHLRAGRAKIVDDEVLIRSLTPDVAFVHAPCADAFGNVVMTPPLGDGVAGLLAARQGAIVTVEKIVSSEEIRKLQHFVRLPRDAVLAVCEVPFGAHPAGVWGIDPYAEDYAFMAAVREARDDLDGFFEHLPPINKEELIRRAHEKVPPPTFSPGPPTAMERAIVECAHLIRSRCTRDGHRTLLAGIGAANLAAWLAVRELPDVDLMAELGHFGYWPQPGEPFVFHFANLPTCISLGEIDETMGMHLRRGMAVLGAAQIDDQGNVNTTQIPGEKYLLGSGGHNDCASLARDVVILCSEERRVDEVAYITSPGARISALVTERGRYEKREGKFQFVAACATPTDDELLLLRAWDPRGDFR
jgi:acyl CoA:acetate/3-ketoacid CoA transferase alpha subunit